MKNSPDKQADIYKTATRYLSYWKWYLLAVVICVTIAVLYIRSIPRQYEVWAEVLLNDERRGQNAGNVNMFARMGVANNFINMDNEVILLCSQSLAKRTTDTLKARSGDSMSAVAISRPNVRKINEQSGIVRISVTSQSPAPAEQFLELLVKNYNEETIAKRKESFDQIIEFIDRQLDSLETARIQESPRALNSSSRNIRINALSKGEIADSLYNQLTFRRIEAVTAASLVNPAASIVDGPHKTSAPISPSAHRILFIAIIAGLLIPLCILMLLDLLSFTIKREEDMSGAAIFPVLGSVKRVITGKNSDTAGSYRDMAANLSLMDNPPAVITVTSAEGNRDKDTFASNLAGGYAAIGRKVLIIDLDPYNFKVREDAGVAAGTGVEDFLSGKIANPADIIKTTAKEPKVSIASVSAKTGSLIELLLNGRLNDLSAYGRENYDNIIINSATVKYEPELLVANKLCDLCIYLVSIGKTTKPDLVHFQQLASSKGFKNNGYVMIQK